MALTIASRDVDGVTVAGILFDAGPTSSPILLQVGPTGSSASHATNPTLLADLFFRIGGAAVGQAVVSLQINSNNVIGDDFWIWRADHSNGVGWTVNTAQNGLVVNGANVTIYGLAVEHFQQYQTLWNGNGGRVYFTASGIPSATTPSVPCVPEAAAIGWESRESCRKDPREISPCAPFLRAVHWLRRSAGSRFSAVSVHPDAAPGDPQERAKAWSAMAM